MKTVKVLKTGIVTDQCGKRFNLEKVTVQEAQYLIAQGCTYLEIVEKNDSVVEAETIRSIDPAPPVVALLSNPVQTEGVKPNKVSVPPTKAE